MAVLTHQLHRRAFGARREFGSAARFRDHTANQPAPPSPVVAVPSGTTNWQQLGRRATRARAPPSGRVPRVTRSCSGGVDSGGRSSIPRGRREGRLAKGGGAEQRGEARGLLLGSIGLWLGSLEPRREKGGLRGLLGLDPRRSRKGEGTLPIVEHLAARGLPIHLAPSPPLLELFEPRRERRRGGLRAGPAVDWPRRLEGRSDPSSSPRCRMGAELLRRSTGPWGRPILGRPWGRLPRGTQLSPPPWSELPSDCRDESLVRVRVRLRFRVRGRGRVLPRREPGQG